MPDIVLGSTGRTLVASCSASEAVGDAVYLTAAVSDPPTVARCDPTLVGKMPAVGVIVAKPTATTCRVVTEGLAAATGLVRGRRYFVGLDGRPSPTTPASPCFVQPLGIAYGTTRLLVRAGEWMAWR